jgi:hypothetical protein
MLVDKEITSAECELGMPPVIMRCFKLNFSLLISARIILTACAPPQARSMLQNISLIITS